MRTRLAVMWICVAVVVVTTGVTKQLNNYLRPGFILPMAGAVGLIGLMAGASLRDRGPWCGHRSRAWWVVLVPVVVLVVCMPGPLGASMVNSGGAQPPRVRVAGSVAFEPLGSGVSDIGLDQLSDRFYFGEPGDLIGHRVRVEGFIVREGSVMRVSRFKIFCCAADAIPYSARLLASQAPASNHWVRIEATVAPDLQELSLSEVHITPIDSPHTPYL